MPDDLKDDPTAIRLCRNGGPLTRLAYLRELWGDFDDIPQPYPAEHEADLPERFQTEEWKGGEPAGDDLSDILDKNDEKDADEDEAPAPSARAKRDAARRAARPRAPKPAAE